MSQHSTRAFDGDTFDLIALRIYGYTDGVTEQIIQANPQIDQKSPILPAGTLVRLPEVPTQKIRDGVKLWV